MVCFLCLFGYIVYLQVIASASLLANPLNSRGNDASNIVRGAVIDIHGKKLADSNSPGERSYPYGAVMAPVTGYLGDNIGSDGVEAMTGSDLIGQSRQMQMLGPIGQAFQADRGNDVRVTVDADIQELAYNALGDNRGAVVVLDAETGAVIAMVSKPAIDPSEVEADWNSLKNRKDSPLLNRAAQGLYPPGSTIKVLIADAALDEKVTDLNEKFNCSGKLQIGNEYIGESHGAVHGNNLSLRDAMTVSCNVTFGTLAMRMHGDGLKDAFERFGFNEPIGCEFHESQCHLPDFAHLGDGDTAQVGIGQGETLVTPLRMAMLASAYVNSGKIMVPYLVEEIISPSGIVIKKASPQKWREVTSPQRAGIISEFMENVVKNGTGGAAAVSGVRVTGKTGTAENSGGRDHGWFIGTAELPKRKIALCIIVENSGGGGAVAAPIASQIISALKNR
ncbi:penicillin-binding transpeptidase domain-containing protein [Anaerovibrio sp.]|uniref:peptidoglycan D,D-transpeptidase FtsI family protein n=1 Tax=Anaerovibrio sp. TaxID=1872532 RepID=UPI0025FE7566|nr:penicillin-binding transpeptidase domain-containing protein [Anaerovibrio sp.]